LASAALIAAALGLRWEALRDEVAPGASPAVDGDAVDEDEVDEDIEAEETAAFGSTGMEKNAMERAAQPS
jgi:hypothetical protein